MYACFLQGRQRLICEPVEFLLPLTSDTNFHLFLGCSILKGNVTNDDPSAGGEIGEQTAHDANFLIQFKVVENISRDDPIIGMLEFCRQWKMQVVQD